MLSLRQSELLAKTFAENFKDGKDMSLLLELVKAR